MKERNLRVLASLRTFMFCHNRGSLQLDIRARGSRLLSIKCGKLSCGGQDVVYLIDSPDTLLLDSACRDAYSTRGVRPQLGVPEVSCDPNVHELLAASTQ